MDICDQNTKNINVTIFSSFIYDENFLYENLAKLYKLKILYVHCIYVL